VKTNMSRIRESADLLGKKQPAPVVDPATGEVLHGPFQYEARSAQEHDALFFTDPRPHWSAAARRTDKPVAGRARPRRPIPFELNAVRASTEEESS
jgi:hypothetical protein